MPSSPPGTGDAAENKRVEIPPSWSFLSRGRREAVNKKTRETYSMSEGDKNTAGKGQAR